MKTAIDKFYSALSKGGKFTYDEVQNRFGVKNPRDLVYRLRLEGCDISVSGTATNANGREVNRYRMS